MTDYLEQYVRCYTVPDKQRIERRKRSRYPKWAQQRTERRCEQHGWIHLQKRQCR